MWTQRLSYNALFLCQKPFSIDLHKCWWMVTFHCHRFPKWFIIIGNKVGGKRILLNCGHIEKVLVNRIAIVHSTGISKARHNHIKSPTVFPGAFATANGSNFSTRWQFPAGLIKLECSGIMNFRHTWKFPLWQMTKTIDLSYTLTLWYIEHKKRIEQSTGMISSQWRNWN